jgi:hypothetical protein
MDFPVTSGVVKPSRNPSLFDGADGFVTKLNPAGSDAVYSTYLGTNSGTDEIFAVALDANGCATVTGWTVSSTFPTTLNAYDRTLADRQEVFVTRLNATATGYVFSTFLGGTGYDEGYGIAVDGSGATYVTGRTTSADFPTTPGAPQTTLGGGTLYDAFLAKFSPDGSSLTYSTYLGGDGNDFGWGVAVHSGGQAAVTGSSESSDFPTTSGAHHPNPVGSPDAFMTVLNTAGTEMLYSTYLGSTGADCANAVTFQPSGQVAVAGCTDNGGFPSTPDSYDPTQNSAGTDDIFVSNFDVGASGGNVAVGDLPVAEGWSVRVGPNPFRATATVRLALDREGRIAIRIVDVQGRSVRELTDQHLPPGDHTFLWDGRDDRGGDPGVGVFFVQAAGSTVRGSVPVVRIR